MATSADSAHMTEIVGAYMTVSDKIRALDAAGYARADIARFLGKRYQHVRNVLVEGQASAALTATEPPGLREAEKPFDLAAEGGIIHLSVGADGSIRLPASIQKAWRLRPGGVVVAELKTDTLLLLSAEEAIRRAQAMIRKVVPASENLADSLIEDRRREAAAEAQS